MDCSTGVHVGAFIIFALIEYWMGINRLKANSSVELLVIALISVAKIIWSKIGRSKPNGQL